MAFGRRLPNRSHWRIPNMCWAGRWKAMEQYPQTTEVVRFFLQEDGGHQNVTDARRKAGDLIAIAQDKHRPDNGLAKSIIKTALASRTAYRKDPWWNTKFQV